MDFLVIDDDKTFRDATCFLIEEAGHYAEGVESGELGMNWLKEDKWDAVLLDVNLGRENGLEVLVEIQKQFPQMPVVMFTAQGSVKVAVEAMRRGGGGFSGEAVSTGTVHDGAGAAATAWANEPADRTAGAGSDGNAGAKLGTDL